MSAADKTTAGDFAIRAAREFKYLLDVQPARSLFNPGGVGDARDSASYARAARLLDEAVTQGDNGCASPGSMLSHSMAVVDFVPDAGGETPPQTLDVLQRVREALFGLGLNECGQGNGSRENRRPLEVRIRALGQTDQVFKLVQGMGNTVHSTTPHEVDEQPLCHGTSASSPAPVGDGLQLVENLMLAAFNRVRDPRSEAYKLGARELLKHRAIGVKFRCPYTLGTAEADAFFAGSDEGRMIWSQHLDAKADGGTH
jgi:hypothetical protein